MIQGTNEIKLENILVGEVWICSGQSNMEWSVSRCANPQQEIANARYPQIRLFDVPGHTIHRAPQSKGKGSWQICSPSTVPRFSATGYYFGRRLHKELNVPIGLIGSNWGDESNLGLRSMGLNPYPNFPLSLNRLPPINLTRRSVQDHLLRSTIPWFTPLLPLR